MPPQALKFFAAACFVASGILLLVVVFQLMRAEKLQASEFSGTSQRRAEMRRRAVQNSTWFPIYLALLHMPADVLSRMDLESIRAYVRKPYIRAGYPGGLTDDELVALGLVLSAILAVFSGFTAAVFFGIQYGWTGLIFFPLGFLLLVASLQNRAERRQRQILMAMPYVLDLLVLILRAGTSLGIALRRVVADYADHPVGDELGQVLAEMEMGSPRIEAMRRFADRVGHQDVTTLADSMNQSEELGWPLADTLERQSERMAAERMLRAQAKAGAAGVMVMLPSTLVLMAAIILLFGPIIVRLFSGEYSFK